MTIVVAFALAAESAPWRARHGFRSLAGARGAVYEARIASAVVRTCTVGIGAPRLADLAAVLEVGGADVVVACGLAGGLRRGCARGTVIVPDEARSCVAESALPTDARPMAAALNSGAVRVGALLEVRHLVATGAAKSHLAPQGDAVDMESFAIMCEAARRGIPAVPIRVIGDAADDDLPIDFGRLVRGDGTLDAVALLRHVIVRPLSWPALALFAWRQHRALQHLARFLDRFVVALAASDL